MMIFQEIEKSLLKIRRDSQGTPTNPNDLEKEQS
jgi:hypothetical protein